MIFIWEWRGRDFRYLYCLIFRRCLTEHDMLLHKLRFKLGSRVLLVGYLVAFGSYDSEGYD
jgi:hypothetical protein